MKTIQLRNLKENFDFLQKIPKQNILGWFEVKKVIVFFRNQNFDITFFLVNKKTKENFEHKCCFGTQHCPNLEQEDAEVLFHQNLELKLF